MSAPLAEKMRPTSLESYVGQEKSAGSHGIVRKLLGAAKNTGFFPSLIFWGPPGCGKTTLARIIARTLERPFFEFSAVNTSIKDIEKVLAPKPIQSSLLDFEDRRAEPVIFLDEIHRWNKAQQDALLPHVERGAVTLLGATTENPSFSIIHALLSRCRVIVLHQLTAENLAEILVRAIAAQDLRITEDAKEFLIVAAGGDARVMLNVLEIASNLTEEGEITESLVEEALQRRHLAFDKGGEEFYNTISALHKSIRGSDPDASLYWLTRMLESGQDPLYIGRRLIRIASEDVGLADPQALVLCCSTMDACARLGMPECTLALAQSVVYLAHAPKSNALYLAYKSALEDVQTYGNLPVPLHIRNAPTQLMKELGYGEGYDYFHSSEGQKKPDVVYLPDELSGRKYLE